LQPVNTTSNTTT